MQCEMNYCIYNEENKCMLESIEIDRVGLCSQCIFIEISKKELTYYQKKTRSQLEDR